MARKIVMGLAAVVIAASTTNHVQAQDSLLAELYGQGVHAFFAGNYSQSHDLLTMAIDSGSLDPRAYYFRGLAYGRLGRPDEAVIDQKKGAELEASGKTRVYPVGRSLQRVQGRERLELERYRQVARLAIRMRNIKATAARYESIQRGEADVLIDPNRKPPANAADMVGTPPADSSDPFGAGATEAKPEVAAEKPADTVPDIFGADPAATPATPAPATPMPAEPDPFGLGDDPAPTPAPAPANDATTDPFADDPFGT
jgi:tetratricopeptide (TPR) repeat protein